MHERLLNSATSLSDDALIERVQVLAADERSCTAELVAHLAELDARNICLRRGRSLYAYCTGVLHLSEHAAYNRIGAARAARRFPVILDRLADGSVNVTTVTLLAPHLTDANHLELLREARHETKEQVKEIVRRLDPLPPAKTVVRVVSNTPTITGSPSGPSCDGEKPSLTPSLAPATPASAPVPLPGARPTAALPSKPSIEPRSPEIYRLHVDIDRETREVVRRLQDLLARETGGDVSRIFARAAVALLVEVERRKLAATSEPRCPRIPSEGSRHVPAPVRRAVWRRDEGRCAFVGQDGRCPERRYLEWHHVMPYGHQGPATVENISLRCCAHNAYEAELVYGKFEARSGPSTKSNGGDRSATGRRSARGRDAAAGTP
jgi:hypothetical protein